MLTPTKLDKLPEPMIQLMSKLQDDIIADICRRITKANLLTPTAEWQLWKANQLRLSSSEINKRIARSLKIRERTVRALYTDALKEAIHEDAQIYRYAIAEGKLSDEYGDKLTPYTKSAAFNNALRQGLKNTNGLMRNLTGSAAGVANKTLSDALDTAYLKVLSGAVTPNQAIYSAVYDLGSKGIQIVSYNSGRSDQLDVAVRRAVLTGINKTACDMSLNLAGEMGCELVEVSSHFGARPTHAVWQGQIYSLKRGHPKYSYFYDATGYGTGAGLGGWNCRHSFFPFFEGLSVAANQPDFTSEENLEEYNHNQQQRYHERAIRKSKRELTALDSSRTATADPELKAQLDRQFERKAVTLKNREARLSEFLRQTGNLPDNSRVRVDGFGRGISLKATWASKRKANLAKALDLFNCNNISNSPVTPEQIFKELSTSPIGMETIDYLQKVNIKPLLTYTPRYDGARGDQLGDEIRIFLHNTKTPRVAAQTVIHEVTHQRYGIEKNQWAEAVCMAHEKMHITGRNYLTVSEKRYIVSLARQAYPEYQWRKGGYVNGKKR